MPRRFILDTAAVDALDQRLKVALAMDEASRRILGHGVSASQGDAMVTALTNAVLVAGVPDAVCIDNADCPELQAECDGLGIPLVRIPPYSGTAKPIERVFGNFAQHLRAMGLPELSYTDNSGRPWR